MKNAGCNDFFSSLGDIPLPARGSQVVVGLSGGVDSSLAAVLMAERGCAVTGVTMSINDPSLVFSPGGGTGCYAPLSEENEAACRRLCTEIGAEYQVIDLTAAYRREVLDYFREEYLRGRTPNPCLRCNREVKFGLLPETVRGRGIPFDYFVTGHYARLLAPGSDPERGVYLAPAPDSSKDQSYFLQRLRQDQLALCRFPLGTMTKAAVRAEARRRGLGTADKKDSQDFLSREDFDAVFACSPAAEGDLVHTDGRVLGRHRGLNRYTIGQRRGVGVSLGPDPLYVVALDSLGNRVVVGPETGLFSPVLEASGAVWAPGFGTEPFRAWVKVRAAAAPAAATVIPREGDLIRVEFDIPQRAVAPGQSAAFYVPVRDRDRPGGSPGCAGDPRGRKNLEGTILAGGAVIGTAMPHAP